MSAPMTDLLTRLLDATPAPPDASDPELLLAAFDAMLATRAILLHSNAVPSAPPSEPACRDLADELARRDQAWISALGLARNAVADRLVAVRRVQRRT